MTYEEDLALIAEDIRRWAGADARIHEAVEQWLKLHTAEVEALAFEIAELEKQIVVETTERENARIRTQDLGQSMRWQDRNGR